LTILAASSEVLRQFYGFATGISKKIKTKVTPTQASGNSYD